MNDYPDRSYDTAVNNVHNPTIFVKFKNHTYDIVGVLTIPVRHNSKLNVRLGRVRGAAMTGGGGASASRVAGARYRAAVGSATVGTAKAADVMPNGVTRDGIPVGPNFKVGDEVRKLAKGRVGCTVYKITKELGRGIDNLRWYEISTVSPIGSLYGSSRIEEKGITPVKKPDESWSQYYSRGGRSHITEDTKVSTTMSVTNSTDDSISLYYMPEGKTVYKDSLSDFKSMGSIGPGETLGAKTRIGDSFACTTMDSIIKVFKVSEAKERITVKFD